MFGALDATIDNASAGPSGWGNPFFQFRRWLCRYRSYRHFEPFQIFLNDVPYHAPDKGPELTPIRSVRREPRALVLGELHAQGPCPSSVNLSHIHIPRFIRT